MPDDTSVPTTITLHIKTGKNGLRYLPLITTENTAADKRHRPIKKEPQKVVITYNVGEEFINCSQ